MSTDEMIRVLLVGGNEGVTERLRDTLAGEDGVMVVGEAGSGEQALALAGRLSPDVIIMLADFRMPGMDCIDAARACQIAQLSARVVIITEDLIHNLVPAMKAGAAGLLSRSVSREELLTAIKRIHLWSPYSLSLT